MLPLHCFLMREYAIRCRILPAIISSILHFLMAYFYLQKMLRWCSFDYPTTSYCSGSCKKIVFWFFCFFSAQVVKKAHFKLRPKIALNFHAWEALKISRRYCYWFIAARRCWAWKIGCNSDHRKNKHFCLFSCEWKDKILLQSLQKVVFLCSAVLFCSWDVQFSSCMVRGCFNIHQGNNEKEGESTCLHDKICSN